MSVFYPETCDLTYCELRTDRQPPLIQDVEAVDSTSTQQAAAHNGSTPAEETANGGHGSGKFKLDLEDALTPDPGTEDMFRTTNNKFAFSPGQLSKLLNPKSLHAFYAMGGLAGLEKGLRTNKHSGLGVDEDSLDGAVTFEEVAPPGSD